MKKYSAIHPVEILMTKKGSKSNPLEFTHIIKKHTENPSKKISTPLNLHFVKSSVHFRLEKGPPLVRTLNHRNPNHFSHPIYLGQF
jgi:hypothetical protein